MALTFHQHQLSNGLTLLAEVNDDAHTGAVGFFVNAGTRDETAPLMGVSHFLEHMMFKGTARRTADDVNREFDEIGANYNAFTSHEKTVYYAHVLPEFLPRAIDLLGDMLRPALRGSDFDMEKNVILEEIGMYDDRPQWRLQDAGLEKYFGAHPLGYRVLGTRDTIAALTAQQMREYFEQRYSPDNIVVAAAGRIDFDAFCREVETIAGSWQPTGARRVHGQPELGDRELNLRDEKLSRHYVEIMFPAPSAQDERRYAAAVLADLLGDSDGSRLYWALVDPGLADEADLAHVAQDQIGYFSAFASCDPKRARKVEKTLLDVLDQAVTQIDDDELQRTKNKLATEATLHGESPGGRMRALGSQWTYLEHYIPLQEEVERLMAITPADLRQLVSDIPFRPRLIARLGPTVKA